jgi:hypothetical protein
MAVCDKSFLHRFPRVDEDAGLLAENTFIGELKEVGHYQRKQVEMIKV